MGEKLTIQDIARLAQVSKATVSRVLNHNPSVDPALRDRVTRIVREHGFVPNVTATGLAGGRNPLIGVLAPPLTWPGIPEIMRGVAQYIEDSIYELVLYSINFERNHSDVLDRILSLRLVSSLLAILPGSLSPHLTNLYQTGLPLVLIDDQEAPGDIPWVGIDNAASAYDATRYLLEVGHRRIAHIVGPPTYYCSTQRLAGYRHALQCYGITHDPAFILQGDFEIESGRQIAANLFDGDRATWPSAIFAANDQMAFGVLDVTTQRGIRVPEDITLIGFDDHILSGYMQPPLTTVHQPFTEMGFKAAEVLIDILGATKGPPLRRSTDHPLHIQLPTSIVVRASSAAHSPSPAP
ncbi:MAG: LacI family DNA-binding transcriptional regulator [Ktedonobacterales bacterium]|nr:LacI family DNA-binding transcriptional regulator [Ktedonobacterales bacterium]